MKTLLKYVLLIPSVLLYFFVQRTLFIVWFIGAMVALPPLLIITRFQRDHPIDIKFAAFLDRGQKLFAQEASEGSKRLEFKEFPIEKYNSFFS